MVRSLSRQKHPRMAKLIRLRQRHRPQGGRQRRRKWQNQNLRRNHLPRGKKQKGRSKTKTPVKFLSREFCCLSQTRNGQYDSTPPQFPIVQRCSDHFLRGSLEPVWFSFF